MSDQNKPPAIEQVPCAVCLKEIPKSEARVAEATDYVVYFCGLDCYSKWKDENGSAPRAPS